MTNAWKHVVVKLFSSTNRVPRRLKQTLQIKCPNYLVVAKRYISEHESRKKLPEPSKNFETKCSLN